MSKCFPSVVTPSTRRPGLRRRLAPGVALLALTLPTPDLSAQSGNPFDDAPAQRGGSGGGGGGNPFDTVGGSSAPAPAQTSAPISQNARTVTFRQHRLTDPGFNQPMVAMTILAPSDWEMEGGLQRSGPQYYNSPLLLDVKFTAPDGRAARFMPTMNFEFGSPQQNDQHQKFSPTQGGNFFYPLPQSPGSWVAEMFQQFPAAGVTNFRLVSEEMIPDLTQQLRQQNAASYQMVQQINQQDQQMQMQYGTGYSFQVSFDTQATKVRVSYEENGQRYDETILITWGAWVNYLNGQVSGGMWSIQEMRAARAPAGQDHLNDPQIMAIFSSATPNPQWTQEMHKYWAELARIRNKGAQDRQDSWRRHNAKMQEIRSETNAIINNGWHERQAIQERGVEKVIDTLTDQTAYTTSAGEKVKLPSYWNDAYTDGNGNYIMSNDPSFDAVNNPHLNGSWQRLEELP